ncbi:type IV pilin protein [Congregibacter variabilis]|uniref:Type IV pilin protein n=1 Tax=Congregibacter variabilis TaxID=3081200 RepID=A0ABZ0I5X3_9GAMM|nr:type IV pilin protein [Congregibacter sp. IMCC43200]
MKSMSKGFRRLAVGGSGGFTLIEMMIVVAIIAILASIALPSYQDSVRKGWRRKASACLIEMAQGMERRYSTAMSFVPDPNDPSALPPQTCTIDDRMAERYAFSFTADPTANAYDLRAVPQGGQAVGDARCGTLSINQLGVRSVSGGAVVEDCW